MTTPNRTLAATLLVDATAARAEREAARVRDDRERAAAQRRTQAAADSTRRHRDIDDRVVPFGLFAAISIIAPWLIGHFLLRGWLLNESSGVFDPEVRALWPYFWAELVGGWAVLALLVGAALALRPWRGRVRTAAGGAAVLILGLWLAPTAASLFDNAESDSVHKLQATAFPFDERFYHCGQAPELEILPFKGGPTKSLWQLYLAQAKGYSGGCNRVIAYEGWREAAVFTLADGAEFDTSTDAQWIYLEATGDQGRGYQIWDHDPGLVWLSARTVDGRIISMNLRDQVLADH